MQKCSKCGRTTHSWNDDQKYCNGCGSANLYVVPAIHCSKCGAYVGMVGYGSNYCGKCGTFNKDPKEPQKKNFWDWLFKW